VESSELAVQAAQVLQDVLADLSTLPTAVSRISEIEHIGDQLVHETIRRLNLTFVTPALFDREDIHELTEAQDDVVDKIKSAIDRMRMYRITEATPFARDQAQLLLRAAEALRETMGRLHNLSPDDLESHRLINELENEGDAVLRSAMEELFNNHSDAMYVMKWKEIYELIEEALDGCEDVTGLLLGVVVKNA
jgi:uncharacterized protein Yka (UPF0111/DUF47 family)